ncbi:Uncharacterised protein [Yersinia enterocolitica]|nr:Uncharacterised protein [Yersinia enterocolitica]
MSCHDEYEPSSSILWKKMAGSDLVKYLAFPRESSMYF